MPLPGGVGVPASALLGGAAAMQAPTEKALAVAAALPTKPGDVSESPFALSAKAPEFTPPMAGEAVVQGKLLFEGMGTQPLLFPASNPPRLTE
jgi:hypothetical protein